jgi:hypothetical protein
MSASDVLIDLLEDNRRRLLRLLETIDDDCLFWRPEARANSISITIWHMARIFDVFLTQQARGQGSDEEAWFRGGWAKLTGYDPRGLGQNGWGMLTGYTQQDVAGMPPLTRAQLLGYMNDVYDMVRAHLSNHPVEQLWMPGAGFEGKYSQYQCIQMALLDNVRHLGEIFALQARWQSQTNDDDRGALSQRGA